MIQTKMSPTSQSSAVVQLAEAPAKSGYVYAIGRIRPFFPTLDVEKEYKQLITKEIAANSKNEDALLRNVLTENPFLARAMGWAFLIENVNTYVLGPRTERELNQFVKSIPLEPPTEVTFDVIVGALDPAVTRGLGDGSLPGVTVDNTVQMQLSGLVAKVIEALQDQGVSPLPTSAQITTVFNDLLQLADNTGDADEHRALNYVSVCYPDIYGTPSPGGPDTPATSFFSGAEARPSPLGGGRSIIDVILSYTNPTTGLVTKNYTSVDVTGEFPFLVTPYQRYFER